MVSGFPELAPNLCSEILFLPRAAIALEDPLGALISMALGGIVTDADGNFRVEGANRGGPSRLKRIVHRCS